MCRQMPTSVPNPWSLLAIVAFLAAAVVGSALDPRLKKIPACTPKEGYTTLYNTEFVLRDGADPTSRGKHTAAEATCNGDPSCYGFTYGGNTFALGTVGGSVVAMGRCTYIKKRCALQSGYTAFWGLLWTAGEGAAEEAAEAAEAARAACDDSERCGGYTSDGKWLAGAVTGLTPSLESTPVCTYVKDTCPPKYGYTALPDTALFPVTGEDGIATGRRGSEAEAEEFCKLEYRCNGFSSDGSYFVGGILDTKPSRGICSYVKNPCPPMAGFTVFADSTLSSAGYTGRQSAKFFNGVYKSCLTDQSCKAFNNMRYFWNSLPHKSALERELSNAVGMCFYVKIEETLEGSY